MCNEGANKVPITWKRFSSDALDLVFFSTFLWGLFMPRDLHTLATVALLTPRALAKALVVHLFIPSGGAWFLTASTMASLTLSSILLGLGPLGASCKRPAGPCSSNLFFQSKTVGLEVLRHCATWVVDMPSAARRHIWERKTTRWGIVFALTHVSS